MSSRGGERRGYETGDRIGDSTAPLDPPERSGYWANSTNQEETATAIAVRKRWRRCSTYARPLDGAVAHRINPC